MKKKLFGFALAFAFILTGAICLTSCGPDYYCYDMFDKVYSIGNPGEITMTINGAKQNNWEQWVKDNFNNIEHGQDLTAEEYIQTLKDSLGINLFNCDIKIERTSQVENVSKGKLTVIREGQQDIVINVESIRDDDYAGSYLEGMLFIEGQTESVGNISIYTADYGKRAESVYLNFTVDQQYYKTLSFAGITKLNDNSSINLMKIASLKNVTNI